MAETMHEALNRMRAELKAETARANAAQMRAYDAYLQAILSGLCVRYEFATGPGTLLDHADRLAVAALRTRRRYYEGLSPNVPPEPGDKRSDGQPLPSANGAKK